MVSIRSRPRAIRAEVEQPEIERLYEQYGYAVFRRCQRHLRSRSDAEDAMQLVFVKVIRRGHTFRGQSELAWLYRIADRICIDLARKQARTQKRTELAKLLATVATPSPSAERLHADVVDALQTCKPSVQRVAQLYFVEQLTQCEIADELGESRSTIRRRLSRFLVTVRSALRRDNGGGRGTH